MARFSGSSGGAGGNANTGDITFNGIQIIGAGTASGDGLENGTIDLVPDGTLETDQYLIIDPTAPNHIHIRAGGTQDASTSDLFLGGERNHVLVSDSGRTVSVSTRPETVVSTYTNTNPTSNTNFTVSNAANIYVGDTVFYPGGDVLTVDSVTPNSPSNGTQTVTANLNGTPGQFIGGGAHIFSHELESNNSWIFGDDGYLTGPAMGGLFVSGLLNGEGDLWLGSSDYNVILSPGPENSAYLGDASTADNQIATIGDLDNTVSNGMVRYSPTFTATGLAFTGSGATYPTYNSYYVKAGSMVSFVIEVNLSTVTNFGTGQYRLQLPFTPAFGFNHFAGWCWADPDVSPDIGTGHTIINADTAGVTDVLDLHYLKQAGGANSPIREGLFVQGTPVTMTTISKIYINGTYIAA
jgi:hypothetical protein